MEKIDMKKLHGYLLAGLLAISTFGGMSSFLFKKDIAVAEAKDEEIDLGLKASDFITPSGYSIPTANKWVPQLSADINPYDYNTMSFTVIKGTVFSADISGTDNPLMYQLSKLIFSFNVSVAGCVKEVKVMKYDKSPYDVLNSVTFSDTTLTTYSGVLEFEIPDGCTKIKVRVENTNTEYVISNFSMSSYKIITTANVSFNMQGHGSQVASQTVDIGSKVTQPSNPSATGYTFGGWYKDSGCTNAWNFNTDTVSADMTLYAKWTLNKYNVSFGVNNSNYGSVSSSSISNVPHGSAISVNGNKVTINGTTVTASPKSQTGYTTNFSSWSNTSGTITAARTITANFTRTANKYTVTLNADGGTGGSTSVSATYNSAMPTATMPTKTGFVFQGYYTGQNGTGTKYYNANGASAKNWDIAGNTTLYAYWKYNTDIQTVVDKINNIGGPSNVTYPGSKGAIIEAENAYASLIAAHSEYESIIATEYGILVSDRETYETLKTTEINNLNTYISNMLDDEDKVNVTYPDSHDDLYGAEGIFNSLDDEDKVETLIPHMDMLAPCREEYNTQRDAAVEAVIEAIDNIDRDSEERVVYPSSQSSIENARALYDALAPEEKAPSTAVTNYGELTQAESDYASLRSDAIGEVIAAINAISKPFDENRESQISNAQSLYDALAESDKDPTYVTNYSRLEDAHAADNVADAIEALPTVADTDEYRALVSGVREQYEALSDDQEAFIPRTSDIYDLLVEKEEAIKVIDAINAIGDISYPESEALIVAANLAYANYINSGYNPNYIVNYDVLVKDNDDFYKADDVAKLIEAIPAPAEDQSYYNAVDIARAAYDALEDDEKQLLIEAIFDPVTNMTYAEYLLNQGLARDVIEKIDDIDDVTYNAGVDDSLDDIITAETAYNAIKNNEYVKGIVDSINYQTLVDDRTIYDHVDEVADLISALTPAENQSYYDAVDAAETAYDNLTDTEQAIIDAASNVDYEKVLADHVAAKEVIETIGEIGTLTYDGGVNDSLSDIVAAESAYDAIKDNIDVKAIVDSVNHQTLVDDRESYDEVDHSVSLIEDIGEIKNDEETKQDLEVAWEAYNALSPEEQALVQGYNNTYKTLDDDQHVYDALVLIDDIGTVSYDSVSEEKIAEAREFYDSLTEDQKEQLGEEPLVILVNSETEYARLKKNATILVIILLIVICLTILGGIWFLFFLLKKKRKDDDNNDENNRKGKPVKAMSVGGFLPGITLISHYLDAPYIALYVLAGIAVLLWISILVIAIMKKKQVGPFKKKDASSVNNDEEVETVTDEHGNVFQIRYIKSFTAKLIQSPEETKKYYEELKNEVLSYKKTNSRVSWHYDAINSGRNYVLKFAVRGKTLCVYLPLNPEGLEEKYKVEKVENKRFEDVPCLYRIKNDRRCEYAKELIAQVCEKLGLEKGEEQHEVYSNLPYEPNKPLVARGLIKEQKVQVNKPVEPQVLETKVNSDGDEIVVTKDEKGNIFEIRYIKSFTAKLSQSEKEVKDYYTVLKNYVLSYKDAHSRVSWHYDAINVGRDYVLKFAIRGKTLCVYFALDASKLDDKYKVEEAKGKKFEEVQTLYRIKNDRRCEYAKELIDEVMKKAGASQGEIPTEDYAIPHESTKALLAKGLIKELKTAVKKPEVHHVEHIVASISVDEADKLMSDEDAEVMIEEDKSNKKHQGKKAIINIDELEANFNDGDIVTLEALLEKKLITKDIGRVKLLARGQLDKKLDVHLQEYSLQAVKMILLVGGKVQKAK